FGDRGCQSFRAHASGCLQRALAAAEQTVHRRARSRQRSIIGAFALEHSLHVTQFGILRKDDSFKIVFYPGSDEVEKRILGPVPVTIGGNTGYIQVTYTQVAQPLKRGAVELR